MLGRKKHIWLSMAADLHVDAQRDLKDIGADDITPVLLGSLSYKTIPITEGVIFATYSTLTSSSKGMMLLVNHVHMIKGSLDIQSLVVTILVFAMSSNFLCECVL